MAQWQWQVRGSLRCGDSLFSHAILQCQMLASLTVCLDPARPSEVNHRAALGRQLTASGCFGLPLAKWHAAVLHATDMELSGVILYHNSK